MKKIIHKLKEIYNQYDFYFSLVGPITMFIIHLISTLVHFDWTVFNYMLFFFLIILLKALLYFLEKRKYYLIIYFSSIISILLLMIPMIVSFILTIINKNNFSYIFDWLIYAYALYATIKIIVAIKTRINARNNYISPRKYVLSYVGIITALYTIQMLEFRLIMFVEKDNVSDAMYSMQLITQGAIFIICIAIVIIIIIKFINEFKKEKFNGE